MRSTLQLPKLVNLEVGWIVFRVHLSGMECWCAVLFLMRDIENKHPSESFFKYAKTVTLVNISLIMLTKIVML
jgi:hypothetical protein